MKIKKTIVIVKQPNWAQKRYYCPYCSRTGLLYLCHKGGTPVGLGLDIWTYCIKCKRKFKHGIWGMRECSLDVNIEAVAALGGKDEN